MTTVPSNLTRLVPFGHNASVMFPEANLPVWARLLKQAPLSKAGWYFRPLLSVNYANLQVNQASVRRHSDRASKKRRTRFNGGPSVSS